MHHCSDLLNSLCCSSCCLSLHAVIIICRTCDRRTSTVLHRRPLAFHSLVFHSLVFHSPCSTCISTDHIATFSAIAVVCATEVYISANCLMVEENALHSLAVVHVAYRRVHRCQHFLRQLVKAWAGVVCARISYLRVVRFPFQLSPSLQIKVSHPGILSAPMARAPKTAAETVASASAETVAASASAAVVREHACVSRGRNSNVTPAEELTVACPGC